MRQVLRSRVRRQRKFIGYILYSAVQSTLARLSLKLWRIRERRSYTRGGGGGPYHSVSNRVARPSVAVSTVTQLKWRGPLSVTSIWEDSVIDGQMLTLNLLSQNFAFTLNFLAADDV